MKSLYCNTQWKIQNNKRQIYIIVGKTFRAPRYTYKSVRDPRELLAPIGYINICENYIHCCVGNLLRKPLVDARYKDREQRQYISFVSPFILYIYIYSYALYVPYFTVL